MDLGWLSNGIRSGSVFFTNFTGNPVFRRLHAARFLCFRGKDEARTIGEWEFAKVRYRMFYELCIAWSLEGELYEWSWNDELTCGHEWGERRGVNTKFLLSHSRLSSKDLLTSDSPRHFTLFFSKLPILQRIPPLIIPLFHFKAITVLTLQVCRNNYPRIFDWLIDNYRD